MRWVIEIMLRAVLAVLLTIAVAAPAVAEIGCTTEATTHAANTDETLADAADHDDDGQDADQDGHCAFAHSHCGGIAPSLAGQPLPFAPRPAFLPAPDPDFVSLSLIGPDRPPRG